MQIEIIATGRLKEKYLKAACDEYLKRLAPYARVQVTEVPDLPVPAYSPAEEAAVREAEGESILRKVGEGTFVIALDLGGEEMGSEEFAAYLDRLAVTGRSKVAFVIGGATGLGDNVRKRADLRLSLGRMTFPHQLVRVILLEQVYRAIRIRRGEPYHR
ncbi:MAG: 23S rRNA (pseudouridine(1915)-N(3))-methyltransferase RlmH [Bacillota bacterium]